MDLIRGVIGIAILGAIYGVWTVHDPNKSALGNAVENIRTLISPDPEPLQPVLTAGTYGLGDLRRIRFASRDNEIQFDRSYKGHTFEAVMPFDRSSAKFLGKDYFVDFGKNDVTCDDAQPGALAMIGTWAHGKLAHVTGTMDHTFMGTLHLENCRIVAANQGDVMATIEVPAPAPTVIASRPVPKEVIIQPVPEETIRLPAPAPTVIAFRPVPEEATRPVPKEVIIQPVPEETIRPSSSYLRGHSDRQAWEEWYGRAVGDFRTGAAWWAAHRSVPNHVCQELGNWSITVQGCLDAKAKLDPMDASRKSDPDYKAGWNS